MRVVIFSDFSCPFSYLTEAALRQLATELEIEIEYRAFELYPAPAPLSSPDGVGTPDSPLRRLADEIGVSLAQPERRPRTRKAHEAARFAREAGLEERLRERIYAAYWTDGRDIGRIDTLTELAEAEGIEGMRLRIALDIDLYADAVWGDRILAERLGITGVPTLIVGGGADARLLVGARPLHELREELREADPHRQTPNSFF